MASYASTNNVTPLDRVESALKAEVIDILSDWLSPLKGLDRAAAYQTVMNEPTLLHESFLLLKRDPSLFDTVLRDARGDLVAAVDDSLLSCGETLGRIKELVLRAVARRHFRRRLGGPRSVPVKQARKVGKVRQILESFGLVKSPPQKSRRIPGKGDSLYLAIRDFLRFDWQARLIPHYTAFTPDMVAELGDQILQVRDPAELQVLTSEEVRAALRQNRLPLFLSPARSLMKSGGDRIDSDLLWELWDQIGMKRLFDGIDTMETRKIIAEIAATSKNSIGQLLPILGADVRLFITFLFVAYKTLGRTDFRNVFSEVGATQWMSKIYATRLTDLPALPAPDFDEMQTIFASVLSAPMKPSAP